MRKPTILATHYDDYNILCRRLRRILDRVKPLGWTATEDSKYISARFGGLEKVYYYIITGHGKRYEHYLPAAINRLERIFHKVRKLRANKF